LITQLTTVVKALTTFPDRPNYTTAREYATAVATWLKENKELSETLALLIPELNTVIEQINNDVEEINVIKPILLGAINYTGDWSQTSDFYPYSLNASVSIGDNVYVSKIPNNTDTPPSTNWLLISRSYSTTAVDGLLADKANKTEVFTQVQTNALLANKANKTEVFNKEESLEKLTQKQNTLLFENKYFGGI